MLKVDPNEKPVYLRLKNAFAPKYVKAAEIKNLYDEVMEDIKIDMLQHDMRLKFLQLQLKKFIDRQESVFFLFSNDTYEQILFNSTYQMLKRMKTMTGRKLAEHNLEHLYNWFNKQKTIMKNIKTVDAPLDYDRLTDNVDQLKELASKLEENKLRQ